MSVCAGWGEEAVGDSTGTPHLTDGLPLRFSGTAAIAPIIAAVKDGKSVTYEGKEVRHPIFLSFSI